MTPKDQNEAIAKWLGKKRGVVLESYDPPKFKLRGVPDYGKDLNAMAEAEEHLTIDETYVYLKTLELVTHGSLRFDAHYWMKTAVIVHASAAQRRESLVRSLGLWRDHKEDGAK